MTKFFTAALAAIAVSATAIAGDLFVPPQGLVLTGDASRGTLTIPAGFPAVYIRHFRQSSPMNGEWMPTYAVKGGMVFQFPDYQVEGLDFNIVDGGSRWMLVKPAQNHYLTANGGVVPVCSNDPANPDCKLRVIGGASVVPQPVTQFEGGGATINGVAVKVYPAPNGSVAATAPAYVAVAPASTPVAPQQTMRSPGYEWKLVPTAPAPTVVVTPPVKRVVVAPKKVDDGCVAGKPIETKDGIVQCIPKLLTRIGDAPEAVGASASAAKEPAAAPATAATTAPAAPVAAPAAPAAAAKTAATAATKG